MWVPYEFSVCIGLTKYFCIDGLYIFMLYFAFHRVKSTNMLKLKQFFGERTPSIREGQQQAQQSSAPETYTLPDNLELYKAGILMVKVVASEGKRSSDRSWKAMGAALCGGMLYLLKDKKESASMVSLTRNYVYAVMEIVL